MELLRSPLKRLVTSNSITSQKRNFWEYVKLMFNKPDEERIKKLGPDRACAEWVLRNGGKITWTDGRSLSDYNSLPMEGDTLYIKTIDATGAALAHYGFLHLKGLKSLREVILHDSTYIDDKAIAALKYGKETIEHLQVSKCPNVTDKGLQQIPILENLKDLVVFNLDSVNNLDECTSFIKSKLPACIISHGK